MQQTHLAASILTCKTAWINLTSCTSVAVCRSGLSSISVIPVPLFRLHADQRVMSCTWHSYQEKPLKLQRL